MGGQKFGIIGFSWDGGASLGRPGARFAPREIRESFRWFTNRIVDGQVYSVERRTLVDLKEVEIVDYGDIQPVFPSTEETFRRAEARVRQMLQEGAFPVVIGGDHSITIPVVQALHQEAKGKIGIIHFDAHLDLVDDSPVQGRLSQSSPIRRALDLPRVEPAHIIQLGVRGYNYPWYQDYLQETGITQITAREAAAMEPAAVVEKVLALCEGVEKIYLTFDIDVLDPAFAPGTGANEPGGMTPTQCFAILERLYPVVAAMDITEVNPLYDHHGITTSLAARLIFDCLTVRAESAV